jgi:hypothetical protein
MMSVAYCSRRSSSRMCVPGSSSRLSDLAIFTLRLEQRIRHAPPR